MISLNVSAQGKTIILSEIRIGSPLVCVGGRYWRGTGENITKVLLLLFPEHLWNLFISLNLHGYYPGHAICNS